MHIGISFSSEQNSALKLCILSLYVAWLKIISHLYFSDATDQYSCRISLQTGTSSSLQIILQAVTHTVITRKVTGQLTLYLFWRKTKEKLLLLYRVVLCKHFYRTSLATTTITTLLGWTVRLLCVCMCSWEEKPIRYNRFSLRANIKLICLR